MSNRYQIHLDQNGGFVLPKELQEVFKPGCTLEIFVQGNGRIVLKRYLETCVFCSETANLKRLRGAPVCPIGASVMHRLWTQYYKDRKLIHTNYLDPTEEETNAITHLDGSLIFEEECE